jgi:hypothetical protein
MPCNLAATAAEEFVLSLLWQGRKTKSLPVKQAVCLVFHASDARVISFHKTKK